MAQVFVSYSSKEADQANEIVAKLEKVGIRCWIAPRDIPMGSDYTDEIPEAIEKCSIFLLLLSKNAEASRWVKMELTQALNDNQYILPLLMEDFTPGKGFSFLLQTSQICPYYLDQIGTVQKAVTIIHEHTHPVTKNSPAHSSVAKNSKPTTSKNSGNHLLQYNKLIPVPDSSRLSMDSSKSLTADMHYQKASELYNYGNYTEALGIFKKAADLGHAGAQYKLGYCYHSGKGTSADSKTAVMWYKKAALQGDAPSQYMLALCYQFGDGIQKDLSQAIKWYRSAANQGWEPAKIKLKKLNSK